MQIKVENLLKKEKGITLVALVVTIVILIILATVAINGTFGENGLIRKAEEAKEMMVISSVKEKIEIDKLSKQLEGEISEEELKDILDNYGEIIYEEDGTTIKGIIEKDNGYEVLLPDVMEGVVVHNIYVTLYSDGTLGFSNNQETIEGKEVSKNYGNIKGKVFEYRWENNEAYSNAPWSVDTNVITTVIFVNEIKPTNATAWFTHCNQITKFENMENLNTEDVTSMVHMFSFCSALTELDISSLNTRNVTDMMDLFMACTNLTKLNVSKIDTSNVTNMTGIFGSCEKLESVDISDWNTSKTTNMYYMFHNATALKEIKGLEALNTSNVTNMSEMFYNCNSLKTLDLRNFDTKNVTNMSEMFCYCYSLTTLDLSSFDTSKVEDMTNMFRNCGTLKFIYVGSGWKINEGTNTESMFEGCGTSEVTLK